MNSAGLSGLPPLPKSLSGVLNPEEDTLPSLNRHGSVFRPISSSQATQQQQALYANARPRSQSRERTSSSHKNSPSNMYMNTQELSRSTNYSPSGGRKWTNLDSQLSFLRQEMVSLRQLDMDLLCKFWSLNEKMQEYKAQQSRNSSLSPHDWLEQDEHEDSDESEEFYNDLEDAYIQPYSNGQDNIEHEFRNGHGGPRDRRGYGNGSNSSLEFGDI